MTQASTSSPTSSPAVTATPAAPAVNGVSPQVALGSVIVTGSVPSPVPNAAVTASPAAAAGPRAAVALAREESGRGACGAGCVKRLVRSGGNPRDDGGLNNE